MVDLNKKSFYFAHDFNARNDQKIIKLRMEMGAEGYGIFWMLVEALCECNANAMRIDAIEIFAYANHLDVEKCKKVINEYDLFKIDGEIFFSESLVKRLDVISSKRKKAKQSAKLGWSKRICDRNANALQTHSDRNANAMQIKKVNKEINKVNKKIKSIPPHEEIEKIPITDFVKLKPGEREAISEAHGADVFEYYVSQLDAYLANNTAALKKYRDHARVLQSWIRRDKAEGRGLFKPKYNGTAANSPPQVPKNLAANREVLKKILTDDGYEIK